MFNRVMGTPRDDFFEKKFLRGPPESKNMKKKKFFLPGPQVKKILSYADTFFLLTCFDFLNYAAITRFVVIHKIDFVVR